MFSPLKGGVVRFFPSSSQKKLKVRTMRGRGARQADNQEQWAAWQLPFKTSSWYGNGMVLCSKWPKSMALCWFSLIIRATKSRNVALIFWGLIVETRDHEHESNCETYILNPKWEIARSLSDPYHGMFLPGLLEWWYWSWRSFFRASAEFGPVDSAMATSTGGRWLFVGLLRC